MASSQDPKYGSYINNTIVQRLHRDLGYENGGIPESYNGAILRKEINLKTLNDPKHKVFLQLDLPSNPDKRKVYYTVADSLINMLNALLADPTMTDKFSLFYITSGYRTLANQEQTAREYAGQAAKVGTSPHGWSIAVDFQWDEGSKGGIIANKSSNSNELLRGFKSAVYQWLHANAWQYGFYNGYPDGRLHDGNALDEHWHWELHPVTAFSMGAGAFGAPAALPAKYLPDGATSSDPNLQNKNFAQSLNTNDSPIASKLKPTGAADATANTLDSLNQQANLQALFEEINTNIANQEADEVDVTWGMRNSKYEKSDWIGLKQFMLYLCTRYMPQTVYPFLELIPSFDTKEYSKDGDVPKDLYNLKGLDQVKTPEDKTKLSNLLKYVSQPPPGFDAERFNRNAKFQNLLKGQNSIDLFNLDPFQEGIVMMGVNSEAGKSVIKKRNIGVRAYGQLVLSPSITDKAVSKPGAIGFTELEIKAGSQSDNGLTLITMKLIDVQGNKFTDTASPWSFIFDARPGSEAGDFFFRFGWSMRVPPAKDNDLKKNKLSGQFWSHPGWKIFGLNVRDEIRQRVITGVETLTFTQANTIDDIILQSSDQEGNRNIGSIFASEIVDPDTGIVVPNRDLLTSNNYLKLSLLNPEIEVDENGAMIATLSFRTTGAMAAKCYLQNANLTAQLCKDSESFPNNEVALPDLLRTIEYDNGMNSILGITDSEVKKKRESQLKQRLSKLKGQKVQDVESLVKVIGAGGGQNGTIDPYEVMIKIEKKYRDKIYRAYNQKESTQVLVGWLRELLNANDCTLLSAGEGSGAGINASYVVTTTQNINRKGQIKNSRFGQTKLDNIKELITGFDVFSYRFQGSLVERISISKNAAPNQMTIAADLSISDFPTNDASNADGDTPAVSAENRKRNLAVIYAQMQNGVVECMMHPWIGPGQTVFVKGTGFTDGEYIVTEVTHSVSDLAKSTINIARVLPKPNDGPTEEPKTIAQANGKQNFAQPVLIKQDDKNIVADTTAVAKKPSKQDIQTLNETVTTLAPINTVQKPNTNITSTGAKTYAILSKSQITALDNTALEARRQQNLLDQTSLLAELNSGKINQDKYNSTNMALNLEKQQIESEQTDRSVLQA